MRRCVTIVLAIALASSWCGCSKNYKGDQRFPVSGTATFDGQPIDLGSVTLKPESDKGRLAGAVIQEGKYDIPEETGPTAGKYRVELHWLKKTGKQLKDPESGEMYDQRIEALPDKFHKTPEITVEVPFPENELDFDLKSN